MIVIIINGRDGSREVATNVTRIEEKPILSHRATHPNVIVLYEGDELVGEVQTNNAAVEIFPEGAITS